jgi:hypothetical protein
MHHAASLHTGFSEGELNGILIVVKNENRTNKISSQVYTQVLALVGAIKKDDLNEMIIVVITHMD